MTAAGFSSMEFAVGSVKGLRTWNVSDEGTGILRLRGVSFALPWQNGENVAECRAIQHTTECGACPPPRGLGYGCTCDGPIGCADLVDPDCGCGFWAYYEGRRFVFGGEVAGVIEGYGRTTLGTKGFRSEKARIVALCLPTTPDAEPEPEPEPIAEPRHKLIPRFASWLHRTTTRSRRARILDLAGRLGLIAVVGVLAVVGLIPGWAQWAVLVPILAAGGLSLYGRRVHRLDQEWAEMTRGIKKMIHDLRRITDMRGSRNLPPIPPAVRDRIVAAYPGVPVYDSIEEMVAAHPVEAGPEVSSDDWPRVSIPPPPVYIPYSPSAGGNP